MVKRVIVTTPDGHTHPHVESLQQPAIDVRELPDGRLQVVSTMDSPTTRNDKGVAIHHGGHSERELAIYPAGSTAKRA